MTGAPAAGATADEIVRLVRADGGRLLACLIARLRDFQLAEDSFQDALESALVHWSRNGLPRSPHAWLMLTAQRKAIDRIRRAANFRAKADELAALIMLDGQAAEPSDEDAIPDERLSLIFTCCHPALDRKTSVALTLRSICGLTTEEIARAFVVSADSMAQRLVRARHKIAKAGIPYAVPGPEGWSERLGAVLAVVYLIFNEGYAGSSERHVRTDLCEEALRLCRILLTLCPREPEVEGLLALMLFHHSRVDTRLSAAGRLVPLESQDRVRWNGGMAAEGASFLDRALRRGKPGLYQLQAAIAAVHAEARSFDETDWREIALIYDALIAVTPNPVFELNRIVALSYAESPAVALKRLTMISNALAGYQPYHAVRADLLARLGENELAREAYQTAIRLSGTQAERSFLTERFARLRNENNQAPGRSEQHRTL